MTNAEKAPKVKTLVSIASFPVASAAAVIQPSPFFKDTINTQKIDKSKAIQTPYSTFKVPRQRFVFPICP